MSSLIKISSCLLPQYVVSLLVNKHNIWCWDVFLACFSAYVKEYHKERVSRVSLLFSLLSKKRRIRMQTKTTILQTPKQVIKRDGTLVPFDYFKIRQAIANANVNV